MGENPQVLVAEEGEIVALESILEDFPTQPHVTRRLCYRGGVLVLTTPFLSTMTQPEVVMESGSIGKLHAAFFVVASALLCGNHPVFESTDCLLSL